MVKYIENDLNNLVRNAYASYRDILDNIYNKGDVMEFACGITNIFWMLSALRCINHNLEVVTFDLQDGRRFYSIFLF